MIAPPFPDFETLNLKGRVKFIKIGERVFAYNVRDSFLIEMPNDSPFTKEAITTTNPPVKTLILHTTYDCNLSCEHCYMNAGRMTGREEMDSSELSRIVREFGQMGGIGVDLSGGEALLKKGIEDVIKTAREQKLRTVVLSNAADLNPAQLKTIAPNIDGIAVGLDGLCDANDRIRGDGAFDRTLKGLDIIAREGIELSFTTLITPESIPQLLDFPNFISRYGGRSWSLVMPRPSGRFASQEDKINDTYTQWEIAKSKGLLRDLHERSKEHNLVVILDHILVPGAKKRVEAESRDFVYELYNKGRACWDNTLTVMPNGDVKCCLFFDGQIYGNTRDTPLREVYESSRRKLALDEFRKYPIDKCPFIEKTQLEQFSGKLK